MEFRKKNGSRNTTWIGCDMKGCSFRGHAFCFDMIFIPKKPIKEHEFLCDTHKL